MTHDDVQRWLERYVAAWDTYDPAAIGALFADEAEYRYQPWAEPLVGRDAIVAELARRTRTSPRRGPRTTTSGRSMASGPRRSARAAIRTRTARSATLYHNHFALRFDGHGKCVEFVEYFMELPEKLRPTS